MPNWCENNWEIQAKSEELAREIASKLAFEDNESSFESVIPMPAILKKTQSGSMTINGEKCSYWITEEVPSTTPLGESEQGVVRKSWRGHLEISRKPTAEEQAELDRIGHNTWYSWAIANWGTKWDACDVDMTVQGSTIYIGFNTAWGPPFPVYDAMKVWLPKGAEFIARYGGVEMDMEEGEFALME